MTEAEKWFAKCLFGARELYNKAFLVLDEIRSSGEWKDGFESFGDYLNDLQGRLQEISPTLPVSISQIYQRLRYIKRARALGMDPEDLLGYPHPSVIDKVWALASWDRGTGEPTGFHNPLVEAQLRDRYGDSTPVPEIVKELAQDALVLPSASQASKLVSDLTTAGTEQVTYNWSLIGSRVLELTAWVKRTDTEGHLVSSDRHNILLDNNTPDWILQDLSRRLGIHWMDKEEEDLPFDI